MEALLGAHLSGGILHGGDHALCQRLGHIADAQADDLFFGVCFLIGGHLVGNVHEQVACLQLAVMVIHFHKLFPHFIRLPALSGRFASSSPKGRADAASTPAEADR